MPFYMFQAAYTADSWKYQVEKPENPRQRIEQLAEAVGGRLVNMFYSFGEYDIVSLLEMPSDEAMAAHVLAALSGGSVKASKTTPLLTLEQGVTVMETASTVRAGYRPPV